MGVSALAIDKVTQFQIVQIQFPAKTQGTGDVTLLQAGIASPGAGEQATGKGRR